MNLKTGILFLVFCVALGGVIVGQRLKVRSVGFEAASLQRELNLLAEEQRVLDAELARKRNPAEMMRKVREAGIPLLPPEVQPVPGIKPKAG